MKKLLISLMFLFIFASAAEANLLTNGSFESGTAPGSYTTLNSVDNSTITGWTVDGGSIDYIGSYWQAADGTRSIDLCGNNAGSITQTFATAPGQEYKVDFSMAGNPDGGSPTKNLAAVVKSDGNTAAYFEFNTTGKTELDMGWLTKSFAFTANGASSTLTFYGLNFGSPYGAALDNVSVSAVPIPAALYLFASGLIGLFAVPRRRDENYFA